MLFKIVEKLIQQPELIVKLKEGDLDLPGVSIMEKRAILDVLTTEGVQGVDITMYYWK